MENQLVSEYNSFHDFIADFIVITNISCNLLVQWVIYISYIHEYMHNICWLVKWVWPSLTNFSIYPDLWIMNIPSSRAVANQSW